MASGASVTMRDSRPYSMIVKDLLFGSSSMTFEKGLGEKIDDAFDANGNPHFQTIHSSNGNHYLIIMNPGNDLFTLASLLGLAPSMKKKADTKIGLRHKGSMATIWHMGPKRLMSLSRNRLAKVQELLFETGAYIEMVKGHEEDYCNKILSPSHFTAGQTALTTDTLGFLTELFGEIKNEDSKAQMMSLLKGEHSFVMNVLEFDPKHRLFGQLDSSIKDCLHNFNLYHSAILKSSEDNQIVYYDAEGKCVILDHTTAIDLIPAEHTNYLKAEVDVVCDESRVTKSVTIQNDDGEDTVKEYEEVKQEETVLKVAMSINGKPEEGSKTFYITDKPNAKNFKDSQPLDTYANWSKRKHYATFEVFWTQLSAAEDDAQMKALRSMKDHPSIKSNFKSTDELRGVFVEWNGRLLGRPYWCSDWGATKNAGPLRILIRIRGSHYLAEALFKAQGDKSELDLTEANPVVKRLLEHLVHYPLKELLQSTKRQAILNDYSDRTGEDVSKSSQYYKGYKVEWNKNHFELIRHGSFPSGSGAAPPAKREKRSTATQEREPTQLPFQFTKKKRDGSDASSVTSSKSSVSVESGKKTTVENDVTDGTTTNHIVGNHTNDHSKVAGHIRLTPKSPRDVIRRLKALLAAFSTEQLDAIEQRVSTETQDGMTRHFRSINDLEDLVKALAL